MSGFKLTEGAVSKLMRGEEVDKPIFQILGFKKIAGQGGSDRYRLNISDGTHSHTFAMLATQLNHMIPEGQLDNFCVIQAEKVVSNAVNGKRVLIILDLNVLAPGTQIGSKMGNPVQYTGIGNPDVSAIMATQQNQRNQPLQPQPQPLRVVQESAGALQNRSPTVNKYGNRHARQDLDNPYECGGGPAMPIRDVNPYNSTKVAIKARITNKTPIKTWSNSRGDGKLFSMDLLDDSGEIRMTFFTQQVDQFFDILQVGGVFLIRNFFVKAANKQFSTLNNEYEISANNDTQVYPCSDAESSDIPVVSYDFVEIANIESVEKDKIIDVIGVCKRLGEIQTFMSKNTNKEFTKRDITLVDKTNREINLTLWGKQAEDFTDESNPIVTVKGAKVSDFNGRSLSCLNSSAFVLNPDMPEAHILRGWYDNEGFSTESFSLSTSRAGGSSSTPWKMIHEATSPDNPAAQDKGDYFMSKVMVMAVRRENALYKACPEPSCNKKVVDGGNGFYRCEKCNKDTPEYKYRAMLNVNFADASDFIWATCFQESAEMVLGHSADELGNIMETDPEGFDAIIKDASFKTFIGKFKTKMETFNNETRLKHTVMELHSVNYAEYAKKLLSELKECGFA